MQTTTAAQPNWYTLWRTFMRIVLVGLIAVLVVGFIAVLPLLLSSRLLPAEPTRLQVLELIATNTFSIFALIMSPVLILLVVMAIGVVVNLIMRIMTRQSIPIIERTSVKRLLLVSLITIGLIAAIAVVIELTSPIEYAIDPHFTFTGTCAPSITTVAFLDQNRNKLRDANEPILANVHVTATIATLSTTGSGYTDKSFDFETDTNGTVVINDPDELRRSMATEGFGIHFCPHKQIALKVQAPTGYTATTPITFGPSDMASNLSSVIYIGFTKE